MPEHEKKKRILFTAVFWIDTLERTIRTMAQSALGAMGTSVTLYELDGKAIVGIIGYSAIAAVLMAIVSSGIGDSDTASVVPKDNSTTGEA